MASQSLKSSHLEARTRISYPCGPFKDTLSSNIVFKNQLIRLRTVGEETIGVTLPTSENCS